MLSVTFIDNRDSFTWNLVDEFARRGAEVKVWRNTVPSDRVLAESLLDGPSLIVLSPGPGRPEDAGCCPDLVHRVGGRVPLFGICLGHQVMVQALGGRVGPAATVVHGRAAPVQHTGAWPFRGIPSPFLAGRYHSLAALAIPDELECIARAGETVMAVQHRRLPLLGVQFHPESILTPMGGRLIDNIIQWAIHAGG